MKLTGTYYGQQHAFVAAEHGCQGKRAQVLRRLVLSFAAIAGGTLSAFAQNAPQSFAPTEGMSQTFNAGSAKVANLEAPKTPLPRLVEPEWLEEWKVLSASTDLTALYLYMKRHPGKPGAITAKERLRLLIKNSDNMNMLADFVKLTPANSHENAMAKRRLAATFTQEWEKIERGAWMAALYTGTPEAFRRYLKTYPFGKHAQLARARLGALNMTAGKDDSAAEGMDDDRQLHAELSFDTSRPVAPSDLEKRKAEQQTLWRTDDEAAWRSAKARNTELGFVLYLYSHPEGKYAAQAETRLVSLKAAEIKRKEHDTAWRKAQRDGTLRSYLEYLQAYPDGRFAGEVHRVLNSAGLERRSAANGHNRTYEREPLQRRSRPMEWLSEN